MLPMAAMLLKSTQMQEIAKSIGELGDDFHRTINKTIPLATTETEFVGVNLAELLYGIGGIILALALRWFLVWVVGRILHRISPSSSSDWQHSIWVLLMRYLSSAIVLFALFYAFAVIELPRRPVNWELWLWQVYLSCALAYAGWLLVKTVEFIIRSLAHRASAGGRNDQLQLLALVRDLMRVAVIIIAVIFGVQVWGYNATTLLAGVGIGGLAVAFAAQDFIANILGTMVVWSDRPYKVGDHVIIDGVEGVVEDIGVRSTRIRMFDRTLVSVPNKAAANEKVYNLAAINKRRIRFTIGLVYDTTPEEIQQAIDAVLEIISANEEIEAETFWAWFTEFNAYSQDILIQCFTRSNDFQDFMRIRHGLLLDIRRAFNRMGLEFAFPTQVEYQLEPRPAAPPPAPPKKGGGRKEEAKPKEAD
ncbi:MAG: mechanosensitive ion channel family protein [Planctomycetales bacterium]|nr:mechanosensitive ion channel family protein [bacterium]UNM09621.1 MAG: mechanosensitive ion channel family protein [Planctomycetales bacterium]